MTMCKCLHADGVELKCNPEDEASAYLEVRHVMPTLWPQMHRIQCPVTLLAGDDIMQQALTEFIAHFAEAIVPVFPQGSFERSAPATRY